MALVSYPLNLPPPLEVKITPSQGVKPMKMQSGRRRLRRTIANPLSEASISWRLTNEEYRILMGWWVHLLGNGSSQVEFEDDSDMVVSGGIKIVMLKKNTLSVSGSDDPMVDVRCGCWIIQEV